MLRIYYASAIDVLKDKGKKQLDKFVDFLNNYNVEIHGAGIGDSPIISLNSSLDLKAAIVAHDLKEIRDCDIFLYVTDLETFSPGTSMELEYARNLGLYTIIFVTSGKEVKNIFLETLSNKMVFSLDGLDILLSEILGKK